MAGCFTARNARTARYPACRLPAPSRPLPYAVLPTSSPHLPPPHLSPPLIPSPRPSFLPSCLPSFFPSSSSRLSTQRPLCVVGCDEQTRVERRAGALADHAFFCRQGFECAGQHAVQARHRQSLLVQYYCQADCVLYWPRPQR